MATNSTNEIIDFLQDKENIESAFDLLDAMLPVIDLLHVKFWEKLKEAAERKLNECRASGWRVRFRSDANARELDASNFPTEKVAWLALSPRDAATRRSLFFEFVVRQESRDRLKSFGLWYGIIKNRAPNSEETADHAKAEAELRGHFDMEEWSHWRWSWVAGKISDHTLRARKATISLARSDRLAEDLSDLLFDLFGKERKAVEDINAALAAPKH
jgi:hypothetical protein